MVIDSLCNTNFYYHKIHVKCSHVKTFINNTWHHSNCVTEPIYLSVHCLLCGKWLESAISKAVYEVWPHCCLIVSDGGGIKVKCNRKQAAICYTSLFLCLDHLKLERMCGCLKQSVLLVLCRRPVFDTQNRKLLLHLPQHWLLTLLPSDLHVNEQSVPPVCWWLAAVSWSGVMYT